MPGDSILSSILPKRKSAAEVRSRDTFGAQTPLMVIGLAAISMILLINSHAPPTMSRERPVVYSCADCGTVIAVRQAAQPSPSFLIEVQMLDGSLRVIPHLTAGISVGDIVQVNGNALTLRAAAS
ncbi:MAG: hypothetical protein ACRECQ_03220 [Burkholderiaceae bacterium]